MAPPRGGAPEAPPRAGGELRGGEGERRDLVRARTAAKPGTVGAGGGNPASARSRLRQVKSWLVLSPRRRATPCTVSPGANVSATSRRLSSSDQRRRARPWKISIRPIRSPQRPV